MKTNRTFSKDSYVPRNRPQMQFVQMDGTRLKAFCDYYGRSYGSLLNLMLPILGSSPITSISGTNLNLLSAGLYRCFEPQFSTITSLEFENVQISAAAFHQLFRGSHTLQNFKHTDSPDKRQWWSRDGALCDASTIISILSIYCSGTLEELFLSLCDIDKTGHIGNALKFFPKLKTVTVPAHAMIPPSFRVCGISDGAPPGGTHHYSSHAASHSSSSSFQEAFPTSIEQITLVGDAGIKTGRSAYYGLGDEETFFSDVRELGIYLPGHNQRNCYLSSSSSLMKFETLPSTQLSPFAWEYVWDKSRRPNAKEVLPSYSDLEWLFGCEWHMGGLLSLWVESRVKRLAARGSARVVDSSSAVEEEALLTSNNPDADASSCHQDQEQQQEQQQPWEEIGCAVHSCISPIMIRYFPPRSVCRERR